ncbi:hypothetical protein GEMRC1_009979 [Eukaryota sp. GEM-RC1]
MNQFKEVFGPPAAEGIDCPPMPIPFYDESSTCWKPPRHLTKEKLKIANDQIDDLISCGFAEEAPPNCPFSSPIVLIIYPDGKKPHLTGDYSGSPWHKQPNQTSSGRPPENF